MLNIIKCPFKNDQHALERFNGEDKESGIRTWYDKFGIRYFYNEEENSLYIRNLKDYLKKDNYDSFIKHIESLPKDITIIFNYLSIEEFNKLVNILQKVPREKDIYLCLKTNEKINKNINLITNDIPKGIIVSGYDNPLKKESKISWYNEDLINNILNKSDYDIFEILKKLDIKTRKKVLDMERIVSNFYKANKQFLDEMDILEKTDFVYEWCKNNIKILEPTGINESQDAIETYLNKEGSNHGINRLFISLLNNKYLNVDCQSKKEETLIPVDDEWVEVIDEHKDKYRYNITQGLKKSTKGEIYSKENQNKPKLNKEVPSPSIEPSTDINIKKPIKVKVRKKPIVKSLKNISKEKLVDTSFHLSKKEMTSTMRRDYIGKEPIKVKVRKKPIVKNIKNISKEKLVDTSFHLSKKEMTSTMRRDYIGKEPIKVKVRKKPIVKNIKNISKEKLIDTSFHLSKKEMTSTMRIDYIGAEKINIKTK